MRRRGFLAGCLLTAACGNDEVLRAIERREKEKADWRAGIAARSPEWIAEMKARPGVRVTASGLVFEVVSASPNRALARPGDGASLWVHYEGKLPDGTIFDSSFERGEPAQFSIDGVIPGFAEALRLMQPGEEAIAYLPSDIAYGSGGSLPDIPPDAALSFRIVLIAFETGDGTLVEAPQVAEQRERENRR